MTAPSGESSSRESLPPGTDLQRLTALVQHRLNNPLAALLAEAQLMGMDETLDAAQRASVERLIELVRRVIGIVRDLEDGGERRLS